MRLDTTRGAIVIDCTRAWAPLGADRFYTLVTSGYYDDSALFRVVAGQWAQFGHQRRSAVVGQAWRDAHDPRRSVPRRSRTSAARSPSRSPSPTAARRRCSSTCVDNRATHDKEPFVVFGRVVEGIDMVDALYDGYGESALRRHPRR